MKKSDYFLAPLCGVAFFGLCYVANLNLEITGILALVVAIVVPLTAYLKKRLNLLRKSLIFDLVTLSFALFLALNKKTFLREGQTFITVFGISFLCAVLFFLAANSLSFLKNKSDNAIRQNYYCSSILIVFLLGVLLFT